MNAEKSNFNYYSCILFLNFFFGQFSVLSLHNTRQIKVTNRCVGSLRWTAVVMTRRQLNVTSTSQVIYLAETLLSATSLDQLTFFDVWRRSPVYEVTWSRKAHLSWGKSVASVNIKFWHSGFSQEIFLRVVKVGSLRSFHTESDALSNAAMRLTKTLGHYIFQWCTDTARATQQCERYIGIYTGSVLFFPLVALLRRSTHRSLCERTFMA